ncbi:MAG: hypothetical protein KH353_02685 [Clostridium sp.]|jgi:dihydroorotase|nr:hypothetical protein [Clostridium sp.]
MDILLKNGCLTDIANGFRDTLCDIAIKDGTIEKIGFSIPETAEKTIDLKGLSVTPGLIDFHSHFFRGGTITSLEYAAYLPTGVTNAVDAGSAGTASADAFINSLSVREKRNTKIFLNMASEGLSCLGDHPENIHPLYFNEKRIQEICKRYPSQIAGLKVRISKEIAEFSHTSSFDSLKRAVEIANVCRLPLSVHMPDFQGTLRELIDILRPGDIFCHVFTPKKGIIENGEVSEEIFRGRRKGILFESACGKGHFSHKTARMAMEKGFFPDLISGDFTRNTFGSLPAVSLPYLMSRFMALGMEFEEVVRIVTETPAKLMGREGEIGCLRSGASANLAIFQRREGKFSFDDINHDQIEGKEMLLPMATMLEGEWVFNQMDYWN